MLTLSVLLLMLVPTFMTVVAAVGPMFQSSTQAASAA
eukprot:COSAG05_NODE_20301_length_280_cov_1.220994_1_plen_36_part_01